MINPIDIFFNEQPPYEIRLLCDFNSDLNRKWLFREIPHMLELGSSPDIEIVGKSKSGYNRHYPVIRCYLHDGPSREESSALTFGRAIIGYALSIESNIPLEEEILEQRIWLPPHVFPAKYFEGFPSSMIFGSFVKNPKKFSTVLDDKEKIEALLAYFKMKNSEEQYLHLRPFLKKKFGLGACEQF
jgi:hypothetical protein